MPQEYDLAVIGSGSAGYTVASKCRKAGRRVALVETRELGGTCPNRGCNPKKVLVNAGEVVARFQQMQGRGLKGDCAIRWEELVRFTQQLIEPMPGVVERRLQSAGVDLYPGRANFLARHRLGVAGQELTARQIFIGVGAIPRPLDIPGKEHVITSEEFLRRRTLPSPVVFMGGGYIAFEFAHVAARAGAKAVILQRSGRPLKNFDADLVDKLVKASGEIGIEVHLNTPVQAVTKSGNDVIIQAGPGGEQSFQAGLVVHGAGRVPAVGDLHLEKAGVEATPAGITVNEFLQSVSNPAVYAGGDAAATSHPLTPTAYLEGRVAARNILEGNRHRIDHTGIPSVVFTFPALAAVGMLAEEAEAAGVAVEVKFQDTVKWFSAKSIALKHAGFKLITEKHTGKILGAHVLGSRAEEVINVFALAIRLGLTVADLKRAIWAYPTAVSDIAYLLD